MSQWSKCLGPLTCRALAERSEAEVLDEFRERLPVSAIEMGLESARLRNPMIGDVVSIEDVDRALAASFLWVVRDRRRSGPALDQLPFYEYVDQVRPNLPDVVEGRAIVQDETQEAHRAYELREGPSLRGKLSRFARDKGAELDDLVQQTNLVVLKTYWAKTAPPRYAGRSPFSGLVGAVAKSVGIKWVKERNRSRPPLEEGNDWTIAPRDGDVDDAALGLGLASALQESRRPCRPGLLGPLLKRHGAQGAFEKALAPLRPGQGRAARLYHLDGLDRRSIARALGRSAPAVSVALTDSWGALGRDLGLIAALGRIGDSRAGASDLGPLFGDRRRPPRLG